MHLKKIKLYTYINTNPLLLFTKKITFGMGENTILNPKQVFVR